MLLQIRFSGSHTAAQRTFDTNMEQSMILCSVPIYFSEAVIIFNIYHRSFCSASIKSFTQEISHETLSLKNSHFSFNFSRNVLFSLFFDNWNYFSKYFFISDSIFFRFLSNVFWGLSNKSFIFRDVIESCFK